MSNVQLLDCTLRDGGYVNNWKFGRDNKALIVNELVSSGVDIVELGFLRNNESDNDSTSFATIEEANSILEQLGYLDTSLQFSVMIEAFNPYDLSKLPDYCGRGVDLIRICIWGRLIEEHFDYIRAVSEKGYKISVQPSRVEQYSDEAFINLIKMSNSIEPFSFYIVDTWGTQSPDEIFHYATMANDNLKENIRLGYHGHNNKMQSLACAIRFLAINKNRPKILDSSIAGMGRGAGNLCTEIAMDYLNTHYNKDYKDRIMVEVFQRYLKQFYDKEPWGYSLYYYLGANSACNPNYATLCNQKCVDLCDFEKVLLNMTELEKTVYSEQTFFEKLKCYSIKEI